MSNVSSSKSKYAVGVDLGGTKILAGLVDEAGRKVGETVKIPTEAEKSVEVVVNNIAISVKEVLKQNRIPLKSVLGIGIGSPGPLDIEKGIILNPPNLPTLHNFNLNKAINQVFDVPVYINNDANCFILGESWYGAGKGKKIVFGITLGTGYGAGLVIRKKLYTGATGTATEIWCSPYKEGMIENCVSGKAIVNNYIKKGGEKITPLEINQKALQGDKIAQETWQEFGRDIGISLSWVVNIVDPNIVIVGGSLSKGWDSFAGEMFNTLKKNINPVPREKLEVVLAKLGDLAGYIGAACLVLQEQN